MLKKIFEDENCSVLEQSPTKRTVIINNEKFFLNFPYVIYVLFNSSMIGRFLYVYFSDNPIKSENDRVSSCPLPNINRYGYCCLNKKFETGKSTSSEEMIDYFWNTEFIWGSFLFGDWTKNKKISWNKYPLKDFFPDLYFKVDF